MGFRFQGLGLRAALLQKVSQPSWLKTKNPASSWNMSRHVPYALQAFKSNSK